jgi:hypothetical protein
MTDQPFTLEPLVRFGSSLVEQSHHGPTKNAHIQLVTPSGGTFLAMERALSEDQGDGI